MKTLTEKQMGDSYFETWNFSLLPDLKTKSTRGAGENTEEDVLLDETEEDRLDAHQQDRTASGLIGDAKTRLDPMPVEESHTTPYGRWERVESGGGHEYAPRPGAHVQVPIWSQPLQSLGNNGQWDTSNNGSGQQADTSRPDTVRIIPPQ